MSARRMAKTNEKKEENQSQKKREETEDENGIAIAAWSARGIPRHSPFARVWMSAHVESAGKGGPLIVERSTSGAAATEAAEFPRSSTSAARTAHARHWNGAAPLRHSSRSPPASNALSNRALPRFAAPHLRRA